MMSNRTSSFLKYFDEMISKMRKDGYTVRPPRYQIESVDDDNGLGFEFHLELKVSEGGETRFPNGRPEARKEAEDKKDPMVIEFWVHKDTNEEEFRQSLQNVTEQINEQFKEGWLEDSLKNSKALGEAMRDKIKQQTREHEIAQGLRVPYRPFLRKLRWNPRVSYMGLKRLREFTHFMQGLENKLDLFNDLDGLNQLRNISGTPLERRYTCFRNWIFGCAQPMEFIPMSPPAAPDLKLVQEDVLQAYLDALEDVFNKPLSEVKELDKVIFWPAEAMFEICRPAVTGSK